MPKNIVYLSCYSFCFNNSLSSAVMHSCSNPKEQDWKDLRKIDCKAGNPPKCMPLGLTMLLLVLTFRFADAIQILALATGSADSRSVVVSYSRILLFSVLSFCRRTSESLDSVSSKRGSTGYWDILFSGCGIKKTAVSFPFRF